MGTLDPDHLERAIEGLGDGTTGAGNGTAYAVDQSSGGPGSLVEHVMLAIQVLVPCTHPSISDFNTHKPPPQ